MHAGNVEKSILNGRLNAYAKAWVDEVDRVGQQHAHRDRVAGRDRAAICGAAYDRTGERNPRNARTDGRSGVVAAMRGKSRCVVRVNVAQPRIAASRVAADQR